MLSGDKVCFECPDCDMVTPGAIVCGSLVLTSSTLTFSPERPKEGLHSNEPLAEAALLSQARHWRMHDLVEVHGRRFMLQPTAIELYFSNGKSVFFNFPGQLHQQSKSQVTQFYRKLVGLQGRRLRLHYLSDVSQCLRRQRTTEKWVEGKISNLEYLMALNTFAGRTYQDLMQYPVVPWVLADYDSEELDLKSDASFRDLSKPIGVQQESRREELEEKYRSWCDPEIPAFHYGSHYSVAGHVLWYLLRLEPYTGLAVHLQDGNFDVADRLFTSVGDTYKGCTTSSNDVKELIPEFYYLPAFLENSNALPLGRTQTGETVGDVRLPRWAKGSSSEFIRLHREALESEYVSKNLHLWIDLVFGHKQRGLEAERACNTYYYVTYEDGVDLDAMEDENLRRAYESQIAHFGQTPKQLFFGAHSARKVLDSSWDHPNVHYREVFENLMHVPSEGEGTRPKGLDTEAGWEDPGGIERETEHEGPHSLLEDVQSNVRGFLQFLRIPSPTQHSSTNSLASPGAGSHHSPQPSPSGASASHHFE